MTDTPHTDGMNIQEITTPQGLTVWLVESHQIPMISFDVAFKAGSVFDSEGKTGLANLTASLLDEGAGTMDSTAFKEALDDMGARLGGSASSTAASISLDTLTEHMDEAFGLFSLALTQPRFDDEAVARLRSVILSGISRREESPTGMAQRLLREKLLEGSPYGHLTEGRAADVATLTAADVRDFYTRYYTKSNMVISVVGDITPEKLVDLLDGSALASLPEGAPLDWPDMPETLGTGVETQQKTTPQSSLVLAMRGVSRKDDLYYPTIVMNEVLGGGILTSRLFDVVREKNGLAYSVGSNNSPLPGGGLFTASVQTNNDTAEKALTLMRAEFDRMAATGLTDEELVDIKDYLTGSFPLRLDSNAKILSHLTMMQLEDLPRDYLDRWPERIRAVSKEGALHAAQSILNTPSRLLVVVGDGPALKLQ